MAKRRIEPRKAWGAMQKLLKNPHDTGQVFVIIDALSGNTLGRMTERFKQTETGARIVREQRMLLDTLIDRAYLHSLPAGSLGKLYAEFCDREGINADGLVAASMQPEYQAGFDDPDRRLVGARLRDMHDLWHVVTGYKTDLIGEASVLAFSVPQTRNPGIAFIVAMAFLRATGQIKWARQVMLEALVRGARAEWLPAQDWEELLKLPLDEVRRRLKVGEPRRYYEVRAPKPGAPVATAKAA
jgi:ubiquinone biosynthesis protein COQ4